MESKSPSSFSKPWTKRKNPYEVLRSPWQSCIPYAASIQILSVSSDSKTSKGYAISMDDQTFNQTVIRVNRIFQQLRNALHLGDVKFRLSFERERSECSDGGGTTTAEIHPSWQYASATLIIYIGPFIDMDDDDIANVLIHELSHYWLHPISRYGESKEYDLLEERICTDLSQSFASAISAAGGEVADHYRLEIKRLERQLKKLQKTQGVA